LALPPLLVAGRPRSLSLLTLTNHTPVPTDNCHGDQWACRPTQEPKSWGAPAMPSGSMLDKQPNLYQ